MFDKPLSSNQRFVLNLLIPSLYLVPLAVAYFFPKNFGFGYRWLVIVGFWLGLFGVFIWIVSMWYLGPSFSVLPGAKELATHGIYRYFRHPMYKGITLTVFGLMLACGSVFGLIYLAIVILPLNVMRSFLEDRKLEQQFGERYLKLKRQTWF